uniref:Uncharacterized protein n=1 Tax=Panagrolaimus sp. ES5 TaxID=591445 RepID=A0AC34FKM4_9BILA
MPHFKRLSKFLNVVPTWQRIMTRYETAPKGVMALLKDEQINTWRAMYKLLKNLGHEIERLLNAAGAWEPEYVDEEGHVEFISGGQHSDLVYNWLLGNKNLKSNAARASGTALEYTRRAFQNFINSYSNPALELGNRLIRKNARATIDCPKSKENVDDSENSDDEEEEDEEPKKSNNKSSKECANPKSISSSSKKEEAEPEKLIQALQELNDTSGDRESKYAKFLGIMEKHPYTLETWLKDYTQFKEKDAEEWLEFKKWKASNTVTPTSGARQRTAIVETTQVETPCENNLDRK